MNKTKEIWITGFALFSLFFGAGNLILPPSLGVKAGLDWWIVVCGFALTAVAIPILAIFAHAKLQGTLFDFGKKVSPLFSVVYCFLIYLIAIAIPSPRTAAVTHEMTVQPYLNSHPLYTSIVYFLFVFVFVMNRSKIISLIGKFLTPLIVGILFVIILVALFVAPEVTNPSVFTAPFVDGLLEGYQTFDAIGGVVVGAVIIISLNYNKNTTFQEKKELITKAGIIAGSGLLLIYGGLILSGFLFSSTFVEDASRIEILTGLSTQTLGDFGTAFLSILVALACFTTAVGVITGASDYMKGFCNNSNTVYLLTALISCILGVIVGSYQVDFIIDVAVPALLFLYPITIVLIVLNTVSDTYASHNIFKVVVFVTFLFSIPDFLGFFTESKTLVEVKNFIPLANYSLGWVLPALVAFIVCNIHTLKSEEKSS